MTTEQKIIKTKVGCKLPAIVDGHQGERSGRIAIGSTPTRIIKINHVQTAVFLPAAGATTLCPA
jgi:hypothetical protein